MTHSNEELRDIVRQLRAELDWAARTGYVVEDRPRPAPAAAPAVVSRPPFRVQEEPIPSERPRPAPPPAPARPAAPAPFRAAAPVATPPVTYTGPRGAPGLAMIREELGDCTRCKLSRGRKNIVFGVGNPEAELMFVGEGPGAEEDARGEPFVGDAGQLLTKMIQAMGFERSDVYIANIVKCRPPGNRDPEPDEVHECFPFLEKQIKAISPKVIVALGRPATHALLKTTMPITQLRGAWASFQGIKVMPTFHPAYVLRNPDAKRPVWNDLKAVLALLGRRPPEKKA